MADIKQQSNTEYWADFLEKYAQALEELKNPSKASIVDTLKISNDNYCDVDDDDDCNISILERAAKLWEDMDMPYDWCYAYYKTEYRQKPINISLNRWFYIQQALQLLENDEFCVFKEIMACDWKLPHIFSYESGLLMRINHDDTIIGVSSEFIRLQSETGTRDFKRPFLNFDNQVLIYELN
jgi:hypothetical protein